MKGLLFEHFNVAAAVIVGIGEFVDDDIRSGVRVVPAAYFQYSFGSANVQVKATLRISKLHIVVVGVNMYFPDGF
jgi:hypothetical protein